jgi:hypothetical protein
MGTREVGHALKAALHLLVDGVDGAAADGIVGVILECDPPGEIDHLHVGVSTEGGEPGGQRLQVAGQQPVVLEVPLLLGETGRGASRQELRAKARAELSPVNGEIG